MRQTETSPPDDQNRGDSLTKCSPGLNEMLNLSVASCAESPIGITPATIYVKTVIPAEAGIQNWLGYRIRPAPYRIRGLV
jgi:hypothetical protein